MKRSLFWLLELLSATLSALLACAGCGSSSSSSAPSPHPEIHWRGEDSGYRQRTGDSADEKPKKAVDE